MTTREGLTSVWAAGWRAAPDRVVLVEETTGDAWTAGRLDDVTAAVAGALRARGVRPGQAVLLSASPSARTVAAFVAVLRAGAVVVPANTAATRRELAHAAAVSGAVLAIADGPARFDGVVPALGFDALVAEARDPGTDTTPDLDTAGGDDPALVCFTSGTTGRPKGAPLTHASVLAGCRALIAAWEWTDRDVLVSALPLFHVHGLVVALACSLAAGGRLVVVHRFEPDALAAAVEVHDATLVFGVPTMWARLADAGVLPRLSGLRLAVSGSAPLSPSLFARIEAETGAAPVERYGMTETLILTSTPVRGPRHAGTVGHPLPGVDVRLASDGVVEVQGPSVFAGYLGRERGEEFTADGWFRTGDIGEYDDDGCLRLVGRASELIITGGYNVYPREVEDVLLAQDGVLDAAVVGLPDDTWGEVVAAAVVLDTRRGREEATAPATVTAHLDLACGSALSPYKRPRRWQVLESLPRNAMGKVDRDAVRRLLTDVA